MTLLSSSADSTSSPTQKPLETNGIEYSISEGSRLFQFNPKRLQRIESYRGIYNRINALLTFPPPGISGYLDDLDDFFHSLRRDFPICCDIDQLRIFINLLAANRSYREFIVTIAMAKKDEYDRFQYLLFLIEFWRVHPESIGKIISENDLQVKIDAGGTKSVHAKTRAGADYFNISRQYFYGFPGGTKAYPCFIGNSSTQTTEKHSFDTSNMGNPFGSDEVIFPLYKYFQTDLDRAVEALEDYIILGGHALNLQTPPDKVLIAFIKKHLASIDEICLFLSERDCKFLETRMAKKCIENQRTSSLGAEGKGYKKRKPPMVRNTNPVRSSVIAMPPRELTGTTSNKNLSEFIYPNPVITPSFISTLSNGKTWNGERNKLCTNIPHSKETTLWIFEPNTDGSNSWKPYNDGEVVKFGYVRDFTYRFCLISHTENNIEPPEDSEKNPISEIAINKKEQIRADGFATVQSNVHALIGTNTLADRGSNTSNDDIIVTVSQNPIDLYAEEMLNAIIENTPIIEGSALANNIRITLSLSSGEKRVLSIGRDTHNPDESMVVISGGDEKMDREVGEMLREELGQFYRTHADTIWQGEISRIGSKMQITSGNISTVMYDLGLSREATDYRSEIYSYRWNDTFAGRAIMQDWAREVREAFIARCQSEGIHPYFEVVEETLPKRTPKKQLKISCSLKGESGISGTITSSDADPYYKIELPSHIPADLKQALAGVLQELLSFTGVIGKWYFEPKSLPGTSKRNTNTAPSKEEVNNLISLISGTKKKHIRPFAILEPEERNVIEERLKQFQNGRGKVLLSEGFDYQTDIYTCVIQSRKGFDFLEAYPSCKIVLKDETISALKGQPYVGDIIIKNDRLKKYLAKRSVATIREGRYEGVSPFTNGMKVVFDTFWAGISQEKKDLFIHAMEGRAGNALNVSLDEGVPLIDALVYEWGYAQVDLRYSRPQVISAAEFLHYKTELGM